MDVVVKTKIETIISEHEVVLFMKGTSNMPQCGFSSRVAGILNFLQVNFKDVNVLDCLLYTSPSPRDRTRSRMPSSA